MQVYHWIPIVLTFYGTNFIDGYSSIYGNIQRLIDVTTFGQQLGSALNRK